VANSAKKGYRMGWQFRIRNKFTDFEPTTFRQDGKKVISEWIASYKKGREEFKAAADEQYKKVAAYFDKAMKPESGKAGRKS